MKLTGPFKRTACQFNIHQAKILDKCPRRHHGGHVSHEKWQCSQGVSSMWLQEATGSCECGGHKVAGLVKIQ